MKRLYLYKLARKVHTTPAHQEFTATHQNLLILDTEEEGNVSAVFQCRKQTELVSGNRKQHGQKVDLKQSAGEKETLHN